MSFTIKGLPPGSHTNTAAAENELDAELFNEYEALLDSMLTTLNGVVAFIQSLDTSIQFTDEVDDQLAKSIGVPLVVEVGVTTGDGTIEPHTAVTEVTVNLLSDTTGGALVDGGASSVVTLTNGVGTVTVTDGGAAGTIELSLTDSGGSGLVVDDIATITVS